MCTFDDNRHQILRCAICDAVRGTSLDYFMGRNAEVSSGTQHDAPDSMPKSSSRSRRAGLEGPGNKQKTILGFFAGSDTASKSTDPKAAAAFSPCVKQTEAPSAEEQQNGRSESKQTAQHVYKGTFCPFLYSLSLSSLETSSDFKEEPGLTSLL